MSVFYPVNPSLPGVHKKFNRNFNAYVYKHLKVTSVIKLFFAIK